MGSLGVATSAAKACTAARPATTRVASTAHRDFIGISSLFRGEVTGGKECRGLEPDEWGAITQFGRWTYPDCLRMVRTGGSLMRPITFALPATLALTCFALRAVAAGQTGQTGQADLLLVNGHVLSMNTRNSVEEAIAIRAGRILAIGSNKDIWALASPGARVIDLHGRTATPGLIDTHAHMAEGGVDKLSSVDLSDAHDIPEVRRRLQARIAKLKPGEWLLGTGWDEGKLAEHRYITAHDLDDLTPANPAWLEHTTGH